MRQARAVAASTKASALSQRCQERAHLELASKRHVPSVPAGSFRRLVALELADDLFILPLEDGKVFVVEETKVVCCRRRLSRLCLRPVAHGSTLGRRQDQRPAWDGELAVVVVAKDELAGATGVEVVRRLGVVEPRDEGGLLFEQVRPVDRRKERMRLDLGRAVEAQPLGRVRMEEALDKVAGLG